MKDNRKEFIFVIGKSEGMDREAMLEGFNSLVEQQKAIKDESTYTLVFFNDAHKAARITKPVKSMRKYNLNNYIHKKGSCLYDAIGHTMEGVGEILAETDESERPCQVCMIIIGLSDDASTVYEYSVVDEMIKTQKYIYKWDFVFYGDGNTAFDINKGGSIADVKKMFKEISDYMTSIR